MSLTAKHCYAKERRKKNHNTRFLLKPIENKWISRLAQKAINVLRLRRISNDCFPLASRESLVIDAITTTRRKKENPFRYLGHAF